MVIIDGLEFPNGRVSTTGTFMHEGTNQHMKFKSLDKREDFITFHNENKDKLIYFYIFPDLSVFQNSPWLFSQFS